MLKMWDVNIKLIGVAAAIVILGLGGILFYNQSKKAQPIPSTETAKEETKESPRTLSGLLAQGTSQECSFSYDDPKDGSTKGVTFVTKNKVRADLDITDSKGKLSAVSIIRDGDTNYIWGTELESGIKLTLSEEEFETNEQIQGSLDANKDVDYKCKGWIVDNSKFNPPSNIDFLDLSNLQITQPKSTGSGSSSQCGACNSLSGDAKTSCLQSLNCPQ
ncbi:MAG: hypothetical protein AAB801_03215 [Patescibacteria group bacterium]